jgi:hypothetical protein
LGHAGRCLVFGGRGLAPPGDWLETRYVVADRVWLVHLSFGFGFSELGDPCRGGRNADSKV